MKDITKPEDEAGACGPFRITAVDPTGHHWRVRFEDRTQLSVWSGLGRALELSDGDWVWGIPPQDPERARAALDEWPCLGIRREGPPAPDFSRAGTGPERWYFSLGYVGQPKPNRQERYYVSVRLNPSRAGLQHLIIPCTVIQDQFYRLWRNRPWEAQPKTWYEVLGTSEHASAKEIERMYRLRRLELTMRGEADEIERRILEQAYNLLASEQTRVSALALLEAERKERPREAVPTCWPWNGYSRVVVSGRRSGEGTTLFVQQIHYNRWERLEWSGHVALADWKFSDREAVLPGAGGPDKVLTQEQWNGAFTPQWNLWKHLVRTGVHVKATWILTGRFVRAAGHRGAISGLNRGGAAVAEGQKTLGAGPAAWQEYRWYVPLPSTLSVKADEHLGSDIVAAQALYERIEQARALVAHHRKYCAQEFIDMPSIERWLSEGGYSDIPLYRILGKGDYNPQYYTYLKKRAETAYVYKNEMIFILRNALVVEVPDLGYATYLYRRPVSADLFAAQYVPWNRQEVLRNHNRIGESLGFIGRVTHQGTPGQWLEQIEALLRQAVPLGVEQIRS